MDIVILKHTMEFQIKNSEYLINCQIGGRKGIHSENGITNAFKKAVKQGVVVRHDQKMPTFH